LVRRWLRRTSRRGTPALTPHPPLLVAEKSGAVQEALDAFTERYGRLPDVPPQARAARASIEALQVELIHLSEEKLQIAQLVRCPRRDAGWMLTGC